ncbi:hypothetical protein J1614_006648 [Plenodomus biglobosus]|nr:hypothetical protein J1614_006648 [Plenodomus biglobosus]
MPAPLAKGIIIAASVIVAAGIAIYESPQVRQWVDQSRRKIAVALHSLGDDIQPRRPSESSDDFDARAKRREELIRRNRNELIRRAREEGVAVDLDELARIGDEAAEMGRKRQDGRGKDSGNRTRSFDTLVSDDGMLRGDTTATTNNSSDAGLRKRGVAGFAAGSSTAATMSNPFSDDTVLFDHDGQEDEAPSPKPFTYIEPTSRESTATLQPNTATSPPATLIDLTPDTKSGQDPQPPTTTDPLETSQAVQSFYSFTSSPSRPTTPTSSNCVPTPTLTPRSTRSLSLSSTSTTPASPIAILSMQNSTHADSASYANSYANSYVDADARSEVFSEGGFTDAGFSEGGDRDGIMTPSSWTEVGSEGEEGSEWGGMVGGSGSGGGNGVR